MELFACTLYILKVYQKLCQRWFKDLDPKLSHRKPNFTLEIATVVLFNDVIILLGYLKRVTTS